MKANTQYSRAVIETNELIEKLFNYLTKSNKTAEMEKFLSEIEKKAQKRIHSHSVDRRLSAQEIDNSHEFSNKKYWEGVLDMTKMAKKQWLSMNDDVMFRLFLTNCIPSLNTIIGSEENETNLNGLDGLYNVFVSSKNTKYNPIYIQTALKTLNLVERLLKSLSKDNDADKFISYIKQIELRAKRQIMSETDAYVSNQDYKSKDYWQAIYDIARITKNQWLTFQSKQDINELIKKLKVFFIRQERISYVEGDHFYDQQAPLEERHFSYTDDIEPFNQIAENTISKTENTKAILERPELAPIDPRMLDEAINFLSEDTNKKNSNLLLNQDTAEDSSISEYIIRDRKTSEPIDKATALIETLLEWGFDVPQRDEVPSTSALPDKLLSKIETNEGGELEDENEEDDLLSIALRESLKILKNME